MSVTRPLSIALALAALGCAGGAPSSPAVEAPTAPTPPDATAPKPSEPTMPGAFTPADPELAAFLKGVPLLVLPAEFPPNKAARAEVMKRKVSAAHAARFVCGSKFFTCKLEEERQEAFAIGQVPVSAGAVAVVVLLVGEVDSPVGLVTLSPKGEILGGHIVGGDIGDFDHGFSGQLAADGVSLAVNRYVWVGGEEKEYVKDFNFKLRPNGDLELVVNP